MITDLAGVASGSAKTEAVEFNTLFSGGITPKILATRMSVQPPNLGNNVDTKLTKEQVGKISQNKVTNFVFSAAQNEYAEMSYGKYKLNNEKNVVKLDSLHDRDFFFSALVRTGCSEEMANALLNLVSWNDGESTVSTVAMAIYNKLSPSGALVSIDQAAATLKEIAG